MNLEELKAKLQSISQGKTEQQKEFAKENNIPVMEISKVSGITNANEIAESIRNFSKENLEQAEGRFNRENSIVQTVIPNETESKEDKTIECECCPNKVNPANIKKFHNMLMCPSCYAKELRMQVENYYNSEHMTPAKQEERVQLHNESIERIKMIDHQVQLRQDIFNAEVIAIHKIEEIVNSDETISADKKQFTIGKAIKERIEHFQKVIFDLTELQVQENNKIRAAVTYFNELQYKLRAEEREQLKLQDLNYKPQPPKFVTPREKKEKTGRTGPRKFSANLLREASAKLAIWCVENSYKIMTMDAVQMISTARNMSPDEAVEFIKNNPNMLSKS